MDEAILQYVKRKYNLLIGEPTAEHIKVAIGNGVPGLSRKPRRSRGSTWSPGCQGAHPPRGRGARGAVRTGPDHRRRRQVRFRGNPAGAGGRHLRPGIVLAGGGALLRNLDALLREETGLPVTVAEDPLSCVVLGSGKALDELDLLRQVALH